jgi:alpha-ketoglutarate-dependent taurine dioxygenase
MDTFRACYADILDPAQQPRVIALLREHGLVTFTGIIDRATLASVARRLMSIRPHRDAGPDGVTVITDTGTTGPGYGAFTDAELVPHTDGTSLPDPPSLLLLTCQQPASQGGNTLLADAARITATLAGQHPPPCGPSPRHRPPTSAPRADTSAPSASRPVPAGRASGFASMTWPCSPPTPPRSSRSSVP